MKKLILRKEVVRTLEHSALGGARGGYSPVDVTVSCDTKCPFPVTTYRMTCPAPQ